MAKPNNLGKWLHPKGSGKPKAKAPAKPKAAPKAQRTHLDKPSKPARAKVATGPKVIVKPKIGPNTTAPAKARAVTAGPNKSFPIGDAKHARLAIPMATRSERAGNISAAEAASIKRKARAKLKG